MEKNRGSKKVEYKKKEECGTYWKSEKVGNRKKVGSWKKQEIRKSRKSEKVEIGKIKKSEKVGSQKKVGNQELGYLEK